MHADSVPIDPDLRAMRDAVLRLLPVTETLYVFGSRARGDATVQFDLDLAVLGPPLSAQRRPDAQQKWPSSSTATWIWWIWPPPAACCDRRSSTAE
ncbi:MAG: nucleotidyltransferase domain-containing protein [Proteobacteria bacterium]|nr:nucleotidyltransferase domain-containing protein [Pseudomonadota bacterium]